MRIRDEAQKIEARCGGGNLLVLEAYWTVCPTIKMLKQAHW